MWQINLSELTHLLSLLYKTLCEITKCNVIARLASAFLEVGRITPDEERLVLSKPVVQFSFTMVCQEVLCIFF